MKKVFACAAFAASMGVLPVAQADVITFDDPDPVVVDEATNIATYTEAGLKISGEAAMFLPIDAFGVGGSPALVVQPNSPLRLFAESGTFDLVSASFGAFSFFDDTPTGTLSITAGNMSRIIDLGALSSFSFEGFTDLQQVTFTSDIAFIIDDINFEVDAAEVPEPASWGLAGLALAGVLAARKRRKEQ